MRLPAIGRRFGSLGCRLAALPRGQATPRDLGSALRGGPGTDPGDWTRPLAQAVREALARGDTALHATLREKFDQVLLETALDHTEGHRQQAAEKLGLGRNTVTRKLGTVRGRKKH